MSVKAKTSINTACLKTGEWTEGEDRELIALVRKGRPYEAIAKLLHRSKKSVKDRVSILRRKDRLGTATHLPIALIRDATEPVKDSWQPALSLGPGDDELVAMCNALGGFPRAERVNYRGQKVTVWINGQGRPWTGSLTPQAEAA